MDKYQKDTSFQVQKTKQTIKHISNTDLKGLTNLNKLSLRSDSVFEKQTSLIQAETILYLCIMRLQKLKELKEKVID